MIWAVGQKVIAELEPELGLGQVVEVVGVRFIDVRFPASETTRRYTQTKPPLRRLVLAMGAGVSLANGDSGTITAMRQTGHLFFYEVNSVEIPEQDIVGLSDQSDPFTSLLSGRWENARAFELREEAWRLRHQSRGLELRGLAGARVDLLPHQLYVAQQVARREFPRVLLADEVGLGKTVEAGLIFSGLRASEKANRVLILVPEALKYQWLAEMYRKFFVLFTVLDDERAEMEEGNDTFLSEADLPLICSQEFLLNNPQWLEKITENPWDLLIVDEAHHLEWAEEDPSTAWEMVKLLSEQSRGLLLLTATPERRGLETEFGLLHLVDKDRFSDFGKFQKETKRIREIASIASKIQAGERSKGLAEKVKENFSKDSTLLSAFGRYMEGANAEEVLFPLIDRHGTGRVLIRNRRSRIKGFAERVPRLHALPLPKNFLKEDTSKYTDEDVLRVAGALWKQVKDENAIYWFKARAHWLVNHLKTLKKEKVLLICRSPQRAEAIQMELRAHGIGRTAVFHERMDIVERDRQAAWFLEPEGAQILLCSEIGSEGRNFQIAHHLIVFDLPLHPDVLEQRIGRLDRIGQKQAIEIHVPYFEGTPEEVLAHWYADGLECFSRPWNGGVVEDLLPKLVDAAALYFPTLPTEGRKKALDKLISQSKTAVAKMRAKQEESTDLLVDLNSFDEAKGKALAESLRELDRAQEVETFLESAFDYFGVEAEPLDDMGSVKVSAHSLTFVESFPGLSNQEERLVTFDRKHALRREDLEFLSWDHSIFQGTLGLILEGKIGRACVSLTEQRLPTPLVIELLYILPVTAPPFLEVEQDLRQEIIRLSLSIEGRIIQGLKIESDKLRNANPHALEKWMVPLKDHLHGIVEKGAMVASEIAEDYIRDGIAGRQKRLGNEIDRLVGLSKINRLITKEEIEAVKTRLERGVEALKAVRPRLDALRIILQQG